MSDTEKYEELRKYFEGAEEREQKYIVVITKMSLKIKELERRLEEVDISGRC